MPNGDKKWKFTGFYGHPESAKCLESLALLQHLKYFSHFPWLCVGYFNEITDQTEKHGGTRRKESQMDSFRMALEDYYLRDLGYKGSKYTWNSNHSDESFIKERLDWAIEQ